MIDYKKYGIGERETKFRVWDKKTKKIRMVNEMYAPVLEKNFKVDDKNGKFNYAYHLSGGVYCRYKKDCILMQYTGLKDKNGKEVYEGDIIEIENNQGIIWHELVIFEAGCFLAKENCKFSVNNSHAMEPNWKGYDRYEIAGNIFENPELLKK